MTEQNNIFITFSLSEHATACGYRYYKYKPTG